MLSKTLAARAGAVVAVAGLAVGGAAAAANAATEHHKVKELTEILATVSPTKINKHHPHGIALITGQLLGTAQVPHNQISGQRILLERLQSNGTWRFTGQSAVTGTFGKVRFLVHRVKGGATFELVFRGSKNYAASTSTPISISPS